MPANHPWRNRRHNCLSSSSGGRAEVDLEEQTIKSGNYIVPFTIDPARRTRLLNGWDDLDLTAQYKDQISAFAAKDKAARPWAVPAA